MKLPNVQKIAHNVTHGVHVVLLWQWTKAIVYWFVYSAGTMSEMLFLLGGLWITVNSSAHTFILMFMSELQTKNITETTKAVYSALPELIAMLGVCLVVNHVKTWRYNRDRTAMFWAVMYALPTIPFVILSFYMIGRTSLFSSFELESPFVVIRAVAGYWFALTALLYHYLGQPQEADRLQEKDAMLSTMATQNAENITALQEQNANSLAALQQKMDTALSELTLHSGQKIAAMQAEIDRIGYENAALCKEKETAIQEKTMLYSAFIQSSEDALQAYGDSVIEWFNGLDKTVDIDDIAVHTGITKKRLQAAIDRKELQIRGTNAHRIWVPSLKQYLIKNAAKTPAREQETGPMLHIVNG